MSPPIRFYLGHASQEGNDENILGNPVPNEANPSPESMSLGQQAAQGRGISFIQDGVQHLEQLRANNPEMTALQGAQEQLNVAGRDHVGSFKVAAILLATHAAEVQGPELQEVHQRATDMAREVLNIFSGPGQSQVRWQGTNGLLSNGQQARLLIELTLYLGFIFNRSGSEEVNPNQQQLLARLLERSEQYYEANQREAENGSARPLPSLLGNFVRAQRALMAGNAEEALPALIAAQGDLRELDQRSPSNQPGGLRNQIRFSVMMALQNLAQDTQAFSGQNARTRVTLSALGYTYFSQQVGEDSSEQEQEALLRKVQLFNIFASLMLNDGLSGQNANSVLEFLNQFNQADDQSRSQVLQLFQNAYGKNENFQQILQGLGLNNENPSQVWESLLNSAREIAAHLYENRNQSPFAQILAQDMENRPVRRAAQILDQDGLLRSSILQAMGLRDNPEQPISGENLVPLLLQYGPHLGTYLENSLPETIREGEHYAEFVGILNSAIRGLSQDGIGQNFTQPVEGLLEFMRELSQQDSRYDSALFLLSQEIAATEELVPGVAMPTNLSNQARETAGELEGFRWDRFIDHTLGNPEFWSMTVLGSGVALLGEIALLRRAGTAGRLLSLVRNGRLTALGHLAVGMGVAGTMTLSGSLVHSLRNPEHQFMSGDNWYRMATSTLAMGVAMGATMGWSRFLQGRMGYAAASGASLTFPQRLGIQASSLGIGTTAMTFGGMANHWWHEGQWEWATGEQWAETALTLFVWERLGHWGWRPLIARRWPQALIGPHQMDASVNLAANRILELNPDLGWEPRVLKDYLAREYVAGRFRPVLRGLATNPQIPVLRDLGARRVLDFRPASPEEIGRHFSEAARRAEAAEAQGSAEPATAEPVSPEASTSASETSPETPPLAPRRSTPPPPPPASSTSRGAGPRRTASPARSLPRGVSSPPPPPPPAGERAEPEELFPRPSNAEPTPVNLEDLPFILRRARRGLRSAGDHGALWVQAERNGEKVEFKFLDEAPGDPAARRSSFRVDSHGRISGLENIADPSLRHALEVYGTLTNQDPALGEGVANPLFNDLMEANVRHLREGIEEAREEIRMQMEDGVEPIEAFLQLTQQPELIPASRARTQSGELRPFVLRITPEGYSEEAIHHAAQGDPSLVEVLRLIQDSSRPGSASLRPEGQRAGPEDTTGVHDMSSLTPPTGEAPRGDGEFELFSLGEDTGVTAPATPRPRDLELSRERASRPSGGDPEPTQVISREQQGPLVQRSAERSEIPPSSRQAEESGTLALTDQDIEMMEEIPQPGEEGGLFAPTRSDTPTYQPPSGPAPTPEPGRRSQSPIPSLRDRLSSNPTGAPEERPRITPPPVPADAVRRPSTPPPPPPPGQGGRTRQASPPPPHGQGGRTRQASPPPPGPRSIYDTLRARLGPNSPLLQLVQVLEHHAQRQMARQEGVERHEEFVVRYDRENHETPFRVINSQELQQAMGSGDEGSAFLFFRRQSVWNESAGSYRVRNLDLMRVLGSTTPNMEGYLHQIFGRPIE